MAERQKRILHVLPTFGLGGQQTRLVALAAGLGAGFRHDVISLSEDVAAASLAPASVHFRVSTLALRKSTGVSPANLSTLGRAIGETGADLLCTYNWGALEAAAANALGPRVAHIHYEDGFGPDESLARQKTRRVLMRRLLLSRAMVAAPSFGLARLAVERWGLPAERVRRIPNGVDIERFRPTIRAGRAGPILVGSVGALRPEKNFARLVEAFAAAARRAPPGALALEIVGEGPDRARILEAAAAAGLDAASLRLPGRMDAPETAYARFDVFAMSSDTEQMPLSLMEAMAAGLPAATTAVGDIALMTAPENRPFITAPGDSAALAGAIAALAGDPGLRARIGDANARTAQQEFSLDRMIEAHGALIEEALARRSALKV